MKQCSCPTCRSGRAFHKVQYEGEREYTIVSSTHMKRMKKGSYKYISKMI